MPRERRIGVIVPFDFALDREYWRYVPEHVTLHLTRTPFVSGPVGETVAAAVSEEDVVVRATRDLLAVSPEVMAYACTSGSFLRGVEGEQALRCAMEAAGAPRAVTTSGALLDALRVLGIRRLAVAAPYVRPLTERLLAFLAEAGFEVASSATMELEEAITEVDDEAVHRLAREADDPAAEALFIACTNLRTFDAIPVLEAALRKPVLTANQVTMWAALRAAGVEPPPLPQRLFSIRTPV